MIKNKDKSTTKKYWIAVWFLIGIFMAFPLRSYADTNPKMITQSPVKQGKYYYKIIVQKGIYRSKKKSSGYKKVVSTDGKILRNQGYILTSDSIIYSKRSGKYQTVYRCSLNGKKNQKLYAFKIGSSYIPKGFSSYYDKKLYYYVLDDPDMLGFCLDLKSKKYFQTGFIPFDQKGRYMSCINAGAGYYSISLFDAKKGTRKIFSNTDNAAAPTIIGNRIYYVQQNNGGKFQVKSCSFNGTKRKTEGTFKRKNGYLYQITKLTKKYCYFNGKKVRY